MIIMAIEIGKIIKVRIEENYKSNNSYYDNGNRGITIAGIREIISTCGREKQCSNMNKNYKNSIIVLVGKIYDYNGGVKESIRIRIGISIGISKSARRSVLINSCGRELYN